MFIGFIALTFVYRTLAASVKVACLEVVRLFPSIDPMAVASKGTPTV
ncbi:MAG: hypothetical protein U0T32_07415 [Chitinophagales bacterium]